MSASTLGGNGDLFSCFCFFMRGLYYTNSKAIKNKLAHVGFTNFPLLTLLWQFKGTFRGISVGYGFHIGKSKRRQRLWKRENCQSSGRWCQVTARSRGYPWLPTGRTALWRNERERP